MNRTKLRLEYQDQGFAGPITVLCANEADRLCAQLNEAEAALGTTLNAHPDQLRAKSHLLFPWLNEMVRDARILDAVEALIGPDILLYHLTCWIKEPSDHTYVPWHQDGTYFGLNGPGHVTAWVALSPSRVESGCMRFLPGSHRLGQHNHVAGEVERNLLSNGQRIDLDVEEKEAINVEVEPGQMTLHHTHVLHASHPNASNQRRIGIGISYIPTQVGHVGNARLTASLVRGTDRYKHFDAEPIPQSSLAEESLQFHRDACARFFSSHGLQRE